MYAVMSTSQLNNSLHKKSFIKEITNNKDKYKVNTMGVLFSFKVDSIEQCISLFQELYDLTQACVYYRLSNHSCVNKEYLKY